MCFSERWRATAQGLIVDSAGLASAHVTPGATTSKK